MPEDCSAYLESYLLTPDGERAGMTAAARALAISRSSVCRRGNCSHLCAENELRAASLAHDVTAPAQGDDFLVTQFLAADFANVLSRCLVLCHLQCDQVFELQLVTA